MTEFVVKGGKRLRTGITTGACAAAAAKGAAILLLTGRRPDSVDITLKTGDNQTVAVSDCRLDGETAYCTVIKNAGDDPDVTDGAEIVAAVTKTAGGVTVDGGEGVGRVTKPGLKCPVGAAAINPVPLEMIRAAAGQAAAAHGCGLSVVISVPGGGKIAERTMNSRLGIIGGISILGTTGIVEPMSERAVIDTIKTEIDMRMAAGEAELLITPGNYGRDFAREALGLDVSKAVKFSNYLGETLDYLHYKGAKRVTLIGHAGKLVKAAGGIMNTHSSCADCRLELLAAHSALCGASRETVRGIFGCVTAESAIGVIENAGLHEPVWASIGEKIGYHLRQRTRGEVYIRYIVFTQEHGVLIDSNTGEDSK